jgi:hypothetical protein
MAIRFGVHVSEHVDCASFWKWDWEFCDVVGRHCVLLGHLDADRFRSRAFVGEKSVGGEVVCESSGVSYGRGGA